MVLGRNVAMRKVLDYLIRILKKIQRIVCCYSSDVLKYTFFCPEYFRFIISVPSAFYDACRDNNIGLVGDYLRTMSLEEINQMEPNGSTALHVAAYLGHEKIVELLLEKGGGHSSKNRYDKTPLDEAKTVKIKQLIRRRLNKTRFVSDSLEWIVSTNDADYQSHEYLEKLETYGKDPHVDRLIIYIKKNYLDKDLQHIDDIDTIKEYFDLAIYKNDPTYLLKAYTAETGFYSILNVHLAQLKLENLTVKENLARAYYIGIVARHPKFERLSYIGVIYRGMMITDDDIKQYKIGTRILTKTFSSSSKKLNIALRFLNNNCDMNDRLSTICIYEIRNKRTALDIENLSVFQDEQEVLILPYSAFKIVDIKRNKDNSPRVEIRLKECEPW
jgi:hypothetical protein